MKVKISTTCQSRSSRKLSPHKSLIYQTLWMKLKYCSHRYLSSTSPLQSSLRSQTSTTTTSNWIKTCSRHILLCQNQYPKSWYIWKGLMMSWKRRRRSRPRPTEPTHHRNSAIVLRRVNQRSRLPRFRHQKLTIWSIPWRVLRKRSPSSIISSCRWTQLIRWSGRSKK